METAPSLRTLAPPARGRFDFSINRQQAKLAIALVILNLVDAFFTLRHIDRGAAELNPLMAELLGAGCAQFVVVKHALVSLGIVGIVIRERSRLARVALPGLVVLFTILALYHSALWLTT